MLRCQGEGRSHPLPQQLNEHTHRIDLMEAGKFQNVLADQVGGVLAPPTLGVVGPFCQAGFWKAASLNQMQQGLAWSADMPLWAHDSRTDTESKCRCW